MKDKLVRQDIGMTEEVLELCKNLVSIESHAFNSYIKTGDKYYLELSKQAREIRTKYLSMITKEGDGEGWCISKHVCECLMRLQEVYTRFISTNQKKEASQVAVDYGNMLVLFLELNDIAGENVPTEATSSA